MELENEIKSKLLMRGFTEKQLLNNRGLIGAVIDETTLLQTKNLILCEVGVSAAEKAQLISALNNTLLANKQIGTYTDMEKECVKKLTLLISSIDL